MAKPILLAFSVLSALSAFGCAGPYASDDDGAVASDSELAAATDLDAPGPIEIETVVSARWAVPSAGLVNLAHPTARAARLGNETIPIVLSVHVVRHPTRG